MSADRWKHVPPDVCAVVFAGFIHVIAYHDGNMLEAEVIRSGVFGMRPPAVG